MSDFRFGVDDYGLNYHPHDGASDGWGGIDWDKVKYVGIDWVKFVREQTCKPTEEDCCPICGEDLVKCDVGIGELGGAVELDPPIYHNYCPNCGAKVVSE